MFQRVETGAEMAAALATANWDAVICDYNLPGFSATAALNLLQSSRQDIPFIIVSGQIGEEAAVALMKAGAHDFIMKGHLARLTPALQRELREADMRRDRRLAYQRRETNEKLLRDITAVMGEGILVMDREGSLLFMNPEAERLLGWSEMELIGKDVHQIIHHHRTDGKGGAHEECPILGIFRHQEKRLHSEDETFIRKDWQPINVSYVATVIEEQETLIATVLTFRDITQRKQMENELKASRKQLHEFSVFQQTVRENERRHFARELHDELGQALTALKFDIAWMKTQCLCNNQKVTEKLSAMTNLVGSTVESVRRIAEDLRPCMLDDLGLAAAIEWQTELFQARTGIQCELHRNREEFDLNGELTTALFRIVQEALNNVAKHALAKTVQVVVEEANGRIGLEIRDDGKGFEARQVGKRSFGLLGIKERVKILDGAVEVTSQPGQGTQIRVSIPVTMPELIR